MSLTDDYKLKVLCAIQILKVDNPKITGDEIAFEINKQGFRRSKDKHWNKGTINHLIAEGEKKSDMLNPISINNNPEIIPSKFELSPEMEKEINQVKPEKTLIEKDFESD